MHQTAQVAVAHTRATVLGHLRVFNNLAVHTVLDATLKSLPVPGAETTLAELQSLTGMLSTAKPEVERIHPS
jgi:hypothetical protein